MNKTALGFMKRVVKLRNARGQTVHLLGTAHVSERSRVEVKELITHIKPGAVFVEVCEQRKHILEHEEVEKKDMTWAESLDALRTGEINAFSLFFIYLMKAYNLKPGLEFKAAAETAKELGNIPVVLGDRMISITMMRFWGGLSLWDKFRLTKTLLTSDDAPEANNSSLEPFAETSINALLDNQDLITSEMMHLGRKFPWLLESLINERDQYMVLELEQTVDELEKGDVVAVVGAAHVPGMTRFWEQRQQERLSGTGAGSSPAESARLHQRLQYYPGMEYRDTDEQTSGTYTKKDLRAYAQRFARPSSGSQ